MITPSFSLTATERVLPRLALNFTTANLDARVTFTRTTSSSNPATYVNSSGYITAATNNQARFDYDPVTLVCKGLLIEESRSNLTLYSQDFSNGAWTLGNATIGSSTTSPDGTSNGQSLMENTATAGHRYFKTVSIVAVNGTTYTYTVFCKANGRSYVRLADTAVANVTCFFDITNGTVGTVGSAITASSITNFGNGWFRCAISYVMVGTAATPALNISTNGSTVSYAGDVTKGVYIWGAQVETGAFSTSYIPTTSTALTRNADVATMTGTNFSDWYSAGAGSVVVGVLPSTVSGTRPALQFDDTTANEVITLRGNTTNPELVIVDGGSPQAQIDAGTITANTVYGLGAAWDTNNCAAAVNGNSAVTDTTATIPTVTQARLGSDSTNYLNGHLQNLRYWPQRITDAETQAFSK